jgi:DNA-binding GntR family transcriptional regulator
LISEAELSLQLGISRGPLREALSRLEGRKLVKRVRQQGVSVVDLSDQEVADIMNIREVLEGLACRIAAVTMSDETLRDLENCVTGMIEGHEDVSDRKDLHFRIAQGCGNTHLYEYLCKDLYYLLRLYRYRSGREPEHSQPAMEEHREIIAAMQRRDGDLAERLMRQHIANARKALNLELPILAPNIENPPERRIRQRQK